MSMEASPKTSNPHTEQTSEASASNIVEEHPRPDRTTSLGLNSDAT